jgi:hypothetical protein
MNIPQGQGTTSRSDFRALALTEVFTEQGLYHLPLRHV